MKLKDIALATGTSIATVSRVINNKEGVGREKRSEILDYLIKEGIPIKDVTTMDNTEKKVAIIVPDLQNPFFSKTAKVISSEIRELGYQVMIFDTDEDYNIEKKVINTVIKEEMTGAIICICDGSDSYESIERLEEKGIATVMIDRELDFYHDGVFFDDFKAGFIATETLIQEGHKEIGIITGDLELKHAYNRYKGYLHALKKYGIAIDDTLVLEGDHKVSGGYKQARHVYEESLGLDAMIACNNLTMLGFLKYLREHSVSNELSLVSFDNPDYFDIFELDITSINRKEEDMGELAAKLLLDKIANDYKHTQKIILEPILNLKGSEKKGFSINK